MRSSRELELPEGFTAPRRGRLLLLVLTMPLLLLLLLLPLLAGLLSGNWALAVGAALLGAATVSVVLLVVRQQLTRTWTLDAVRAVPGGVTIVFSRRILRLRLLGSSLGGAGLVLCGIGAWSAGSEVVALLCTAAGGAALGALILWYVRGIRTGQLTLTPDSVRLAMDAQDVEARWDDIRSVHAREHTDRYRMLSWRRLELPPSAATRDAPGIDIRCDRVEFDPVLLYHLLRFYLDHPLARPELATHSALARLRHRMFVG
jgi:hypothetical protein